MKFRSSYNGTGDSQALKQWPQLPSILLLRENTQQHEFCTWIAASLLGRISPQQFKRFSLWLWQIHREFSRGALYWVFSVNLQGMLLLPTTPLVSQPWEVEGCRKEDKLGVVSVSLMQGDRVQQKQREARSRNFRGKKKKFILRVSYDLLGLYT